MSGYWEVIAPVAVAAMAGVVLLARRLRHPPGGHRTDLAHLDATPDTLARWGTVPVAEVDGEPPWAAPEADRYTGFGWNSGSSGSSYGGGFDGAGDGLPYDPALDWAARNELPPPLEATLRRELHHVDGYDPDPFGTEQIEAWVRDGMQVNWIDDSPREDGAGDESEASGPPAPPAPLRPVDLALARCDLFMTAMRADHERWLSLARERWAAA